MHIIVDVQGWCCTVCRQRFRSASSTLSGAPHTNGSLVGSVDSNQKNGEVFELLGKLNSEMGDIKTQIRAITDFLSTSFSYILPVEVQSKFEVASHSNKACLDWSKVVGSKKEARRSKSIFYNTTNATDVQSKEPLVMDSVLKAVHSDLIDKQKRSRNVVVSGLKSSLSITDSDLFQRLCFNHLGIAVSTFTTVDLEQPRSARYKGCS